MLVCREAKRTGTRTHSPCAQTSSTLFLSMPPQEKLRWSISQRRGASLRRFLVKCGLSAGSYWATGIYVMRGVYPRMTLTGSLSIVQLRIPVGAAPSRRYVQDGPERHQVGRTAWILSGILSAAPAWQRGLPICRRHSREFGDIRLQGRPRSADRTRSPAAVSNAYGSRTLQEKDY